MIGYRVNLRHLLALRWANANLCFGNREQEMTQSQAVTVPTLDRLSCYNSLLHI